MTCSLAGARFLTPATTSSYPAAWNEKRTVGQLGNGFHILGSRPRDFVLGDRCGVPSFDPMLPRSGPSAVLTYKIDPIGGSTFARTVQNARAPPEAA